MLNAKTKKQMKKILPVKYPIIASFPTTANILAILGTDSRAVPWICNNFNQLVYRRVPAYGAAYGVGTLFEQDTRHFSTVYSETQLLRYNKIKKEIINIKWDKFSDFVVDCVNKNYYIDAALDRYYLSCSDSYHKHHYFHATFIYGYDTEADVVHIADLYDGKKYDFYTVSFEDINNAYNVKNYGGYEFNDDIHLMQINNECKPMKINTDIIIQGLTDYVNSKDSTKKYSDAHRWERYDLYYGLAYYDEIIKDIINNLYNQTTKVSMQVLYAHSGMMEYKIDMLYKENIISFDSRYNSLKNDITEIKKSSNTMLNLYLKNLIKRTRDSSIINTLVDGYTALKEKSRIFTLKLIEILSMSSPIIDEEYNDRISDDVTEWKSISEKVEHSIFSDSIIYPTSNFKNLNSNIIRLEKIYSGVIDIKYDIVPLKDTLDAIMGFFHENATIEYYADIPMIVRLKGDSGYFSVMNGNNYDKDIEIAFEINKIYHIRIAVNLYDKNYSVYITAEDGEEKQIADKYYYQHTAPVVPDNIGGYVFIKNSTIGCHIGYDCIVKNFKINDDSIQNTADTDIKIENGSAVRVLNADSDTLIAELAVKLKNINEPTFICLMSGEEISASIDLDKTETLTDGSAIIKFIVENGVYSVYLNDKPAKQVVDLKSKNRIDAVKVNTNGTVFIKKLIVKK